MEKRLFLAVFLSLLVVFGFQTLFGTRNVPVKETQSIDIKAVKVEGKLPQALEAVVALPDKNSKSFEERTFNLENNIFSVNLSNKGGVIHEIDLKQYDYRSPAKNLLNIHLFENMEFQMERSWPGVITAIGKNNDWEVKKIYGLNEDYTITVSINIKNISSNAKDLTASISNLNIDTSRLDTHNVQSDYILYEYSILTNKNIIRKDNARGFTDKWNKEDAAQVEWVAFRDKYFVTIVQPAEKQTSYEIKCLSDKELGFNSKMSGIIISAGETKAFSYKIYAGPQRLDLLNKANKSFSKVMVFSNWGWLDAISKGIYWLLGAIYKIMPIWGLCIIAISLLVYGLMYPLTAKSLVSMKKLQALQPRMKEIQDKYKNNPEKLNKEIVELYRIHQVNPLSGCLPMLLQMPIFVGLYQVLWRTVYFRGEGFLWMKDLSLPDHTIKLPFTLPLMGEYINILPIIMVGIMAVQQNMNLKTMSAANPEQASQQKMMAIIFPIIIGFIFYHMASGLNMYFVVFYILSTLSQWHISNSTKAEN